MAGWSYMLCYLDHDCKPFGPGSLIPISSGGGNSSSDNNSSSIEDSDLSGSVNGSASVLTVKAN